MRVLFVATGREYGGAEIALERLIRQLAPLCECTVALPNHPNLQPMQKQLEACARVESYAFDRPGRLLQIMRALQRLADQHDVVHLNSSHPASRLGIICGFALGGRRTPLICVEHRVTPVNDIQVPRSIGWALPLLFRWSRRRTARVVAVSEENAVRLVDLYRLPAQLVQVIHNGIDFESFQTPRAEARASLREELGLHAGQPIILTLARLVPNKGHRFIIQAAPAILNHSPDAHFVFAGALDERELLDAQIHRMNLSKHFSLLGFRSDTVRLLRGSDISVLPSLAEGFGLSILEALAAGLPTIATPVGGAPEIIRNGENGWLVPPGDSGALAKAIVIGLSLDPAQKEALEQAAQHTARCFSMEAMAQKMSEVYAEAIRGGFEPRAGQPR